MPVAFSVDLALALQLGVELTIVQHLALALHDSVPNAQLIGDVLHNITPSPSVTSSITPTRSATPSASGSPACVVADAARGLQRHSGSGTAYIRGYAEATAGLWRPFWAQQFTVTTSMTLLAFEM